MFETILRTRLRGTLDKFSTSFPDFLTDKYPSRYSQIYLKYGNCCKFFVFEQNHYTVQFLYFLTTICHSLIANV